MSLKTITPLAPYYGEKITILFDDKEKSIQGILIENGYNEDHVPSIIIESSEKERLAIEWTRIDEIKTTDGRTTLYGDYKGKPEFSDDGLL